jgi:molybdopterin-binding protein
MAIDGRELAEFATSQAKSVPDSGQQSSARNRFVGLVTAVKTDTVMAQVELQCGPFRVVSLMSSEAVKDLKLERGSIAVAVIKSTNVIVESLEGSP